MKAVNDEDENPLFPFFLYFLHTFYTRTSNNKLLTDIVFKWKESKKFFLSWSSSLFGCKEEGKSSWKVLTFRFFLSILTRSIGDIWGITRKKICCVCRHWRLLTRERKHHHRSFYGNVSFSSWNSFFSFFSFIIYIFMMKKPF
jgi:hypothetical protein